MKRRFVDRDSILILVLGFILGFALNFLRVWLFQ